MHQKLLLICEFCLLLSIDAQTCSCGPYGGTGGNQFNDASLHQNGDVTEMVVYTGYDRKDYIVTG